MPGALLAGFPRGAFPPVSPSVHYPRRWSNLRTRATAYNARVYRRDGASSLQGAIAEPFRRDRVCVCKCALMARHYEGHGILPSSEKSTNQRGQRDRERERRRSQITLDLIGYGFVYIFMQLYTYKRKREREYSIQFQCQTSGSDGTIRALETPVGRFFALLHAPIGPDHDNWNPRRRKKNAAEKRERERESTEARRICTMSDALAAART